MRIDVDLTADAAYITLGYGQIQRTVEISGRLLVDEDDAGQPLGIEVLGLGSLPVGEVLERYSVPQYQAEQLRALGARWVRPVMDVVAATGS